jgi:hypothetical protein
MGEKRRMSLSAISRIFKVTEVIDRILLESKAFNITSKDFQLKSLEGTLEYSVVVSPKSSLKIKSISFKDIDLRRILITSSPGFSEVKGSISRIEEGLTRGFILDPTKLDPSAKEFLFRFEIESEIEPFMKELVRRDHQIDSVGEESNTYWLHAQLKELQLFKEALRKLNLLDIPFIVNVGVHQDIKMKFPTRRQKELEIIAQWARELDRERKRRLSFEHITLKRTRPKEKEITQLLRDLQALFMPQTFKSFIDVRKEFHYSECFQGTDFYDEIPFRTYPKWMSVLSRTDLSLEKPAAEGELVYKRKRFQDAIEEAITHK